MKFFILYLITLGTIIFVIMAWPLKTYPAPGYTIVRSGGLYSYRGADGRMPLLAGPRNFRIFAVADTWTSYRIYAKIDAEKQIAWEAE